MTDGNRGGAARSARRTGKIAVLGIVAIVFTAFLGLLAPQAARGDTGSPWIELGGPDGGTVSSLVIDPLTPATVYAGTALGGVYKSTDGAQTWVAMNSGLEGLRVSDVAIDPITPTRLYAAAGGALYRSVQGAGSWVEVLATDPFDQGVGLVAVDPITPANVYAVAGAGVFMSGNAGDTWSEVGQIPFFGDLGASSLTVDSRTPSTLFVTFGGSVARSLDRGVTWGTVFTLPPSQNSFAEVSALTIDTLDSSIVYAASDLGTFRSQDGGTTWALVNSVVKGFDDLVSHPVTAEILAVTFERVVRSDDHGETWSDAGPRLEGQSLTVLAIDPGTPARMYLGASERGARGGVFRSSDDGVSWGYAIAGLKALDLQALGVDQQTPSTMFVQSSNLVFRSTDAGVTWSDVTPGSQPERISAFAVDPLIPGTLYVSLHQDIRSFTELFRTRDHGDTWEPIGLDVTCDTEFFCGADDILFTNTADSIYIVPSDDQELIQFSDDGGDTSVPRGGNRSPLFDILLNARFVDPSDSQTLFVGATFDGVFRSHDGAETWNQANNGLEDPSDPGRSISVTAAAADPSTPGTLYATLFIRWPFDVFKSMDGGDSWVGVGAFPGSVDSLLVDPTNPSNLYATQRGEGVVRSLDSGATWLPFDDGISGWVRGLTTDGSDPANLYAVANGRVYFNDNLPPPPDADGDGIPDDDDRFPNSNTNPTVSFDGLDTGVGNQLLPDGATFNDLIGEAAANATDHGDFISEVAALTNEWRKAGLISGSDTGKIQVAAAKSSLP